MIDIIVKNDLQELGGVEAAPCVSLFLPTHMSGPSVAEDPIRLKNLVAQAKKELVATGMRTSEASELVAPIQTLIDDALFWAHSSEGLAVYVTTDGMQHLRLSGPVEEGVMVANRFWISPLLPFVSPERSFLVLALSENQVRVLRGTRHTMVELELGSIPASMDEALRFDDRESQLHSHGAAPVGAGSVSATFHGQGVASDFDDVDLDRFLHAVDRGLAEIKGAGDEPLVVAGVSEIVSRFRKHHGVSSTGDAFVAGNPEKLSPMDLHKRAFPLVMPHLDADRLRAVRSLGLTSNQKATTLPDIIEAAKSGRVADVLVARNHRRWGSFNPQTSAVEEHPERRQGDLDLVDLAVRETLAHKGSAFATDPGELGDDESVVAVLRY